MNQTRRTVGTAILLLFLFAFGCFIDILPFHETFLLRDLSSIYFLAVSLVAILYFYRTVVDEKIKNYIIAIGSMIAFCLFLRIEKYVAFKESVLASRYLWYAYYIPAIMIPQLSFSLSLMVGKSNSKKSKLSFFSGAVSIVLLTLTLTNDFHQLMFRFNNGFENVDDYTHQPIYYVVFAWSLVIMISAIIILIRKCSITANKKLAVVLVFYIAIFSVWLPLTVSSLRPTVNGQHFGEFTEILSFLMGGVLALCISIGLIPSNIGYDKLISTIGFSAQIADADYKVVYRSGSAVDMTEEQMMQTEAMLDDNTKMFRKNVSGGYAYWQVDISELNAINSELEVVKETLSEETEIIRLENELKEKRAKIDEKSKVYDNIAVKVYNQSMMIKSLSKQAKRQPEMFDRNMMTVCVYAAYIKRMANLMLLASDNEKINKVELLLSINESARFLRKTGVVADVVAQFEDDYISSSQAVYLYEAFQSLIEKAADNLKAISVIIGDDDVKIFVEGAAVDLPNVPVEIDEDTSFVTLSVRKEAAV